jgi:hypothetical protein
MILKFCDGNESFEGEENYRYFSIIDNNNFEGLLLKQNSSKAEELNVDYSTIV